MNLKSKLVSGAFIFLLIQTNVWAGSSGGYSWGCVDWVSSSGTTKKSYCFVDEPSEEPGDVQFYYIDTQLISSVNLNGNFYANYNLRQGDFYHVGVSLHNEKTWYHLTEHPNGGQFDRIPLCIYGNWGYNVYGSTTFTTLPGFADCKNHYGAN